MLQPGGESDWGTRKKRKILGDEVSECTGVSSGRLLNYFITIAFTRRDKRNNRVLDIFT